MTVFIMHGGKEKGREKMGKFMTSFWSSWQAGIKDQSNKISQESHPAFTICRDFPRQSHTSVDARRDFSRWSHQTCWVRGRKSDLGLIIDIAQLFSSNVRIRELWWLGDLTHSRFAQQKPISRDCPRKAGAFDDSVDGRSYLSKLSPANGTKSERGDSWGHFDLGELFNTCLVPLGL